LESLGDPAGLNVLNVVEVEAGDGQDFQIVDSGGFIPAASGECGIVRLEAPWDECGESAGFVLEAADDFKVVDPLFQSFVHTKHHGGGGAHAELMGGAVDEHPVFRSA